MGVAAASAIAQRAFADARVRTISFALLFFLGALTQAIAYREGYPTLGERLKFARTVGKNDAARLLYGTPHDLLTVAATSAGVSAGRWRSSRRSLGFSVRSAPCAQRRTRGGPT
jgi:hypothetical protein